MKNEKGGIIVTILIILGVIFVVGLLFGGIGNATPGSNPDESPPLSITAYPEDPDRCAEGVFTSQTVNGNGDVSHGHPHYVCLDGVEGVEGPPGPRGPAGPAGPPGEDGEDGKDGTATIDDVTVDVTDFRTKNCHTTVVVTVEVNGVSDTDSTRFGGCNRAARLVT